MKRKMVNIDLEKAFFSARNWQMFSTGLTLELINDSIIVYDLKHVQFVIFSFLSGIFNGLVFGDAQKLVVA